MKETPKQRRLKRLLENKAYEEKMAYLNKVDFSTAIKDVLIKLKEEKFEEISLTEVNWLLKKLE